MANIGICTSHYAIFFKLYVPEFIQAHYNNTTTASPRPPAGDAINCACIGDELAVIKVPA